MKRNFFTLVMMIIFLAACGKEEPAPGPTPTPTPTPESSVVFETGTDTKPVLASDGGKVYLKFNATGAWTASVINANADDWITLDKTGGEAGTTTVTVTVLRNDTTDERNATVVIKCGTATATAVVTQKQKDALTVTAAKNEIEAAGGTFSIEVKANIDFTYEIAESCKEWLTYTGTKAMNTSTLNFTVAANPETARREGSVKIKSSLGEEVIKVYQAGEVPAMILTKNDYVVKSEGETITVEVTSNVNVSVSIAGSAKDWIKAPATKSMSTNTYYFVISANEGVDPRCGEILFTNTANGLSEKVTVTQVQKDALVVAKDSYQLPVEGGGIEIEIGHNVDFTVSMDKDWVRQIDTKAYTIETLAFTVAPNENVDNREATITFTSKDKSITQTVKVYQAGESPSIILTKKDYVVKSEGEIITVEVTSNVNVSVAISDLAKDWIKSLATKTMSSSTYYFVISANEGVDPRYGEIIFTNTANGLSENVSVTQMQNDILVVAKDSCQVPRDGGYIELEVEHNIDFTVSIDKDWIMYLGTFSTKACTTEVLRFYVYPIYNGLEEKRVAAITLTSVDGNKVQKITVIQEDAKCGLQRLEKYTTLSRDKITAVNFITGSDKTTSKMTNEGGYPIYGETVGTTVNIYTKADKFLVDLSPFRLSVPYSSPIEIRGYFEDCTSIKTLDLRSWDTSISDNMSRTFLDCKSLESLDISSFDTEAVKDMQYMFSNCPCLTTIDLSSFRTPVLQKMDYMFSITDLSRASKLERLDLSNFDTSQLESTYCMVQMHTCLKELDLTGWKSDIGNVDFMLLGTGAAVSSGMNVRCSQNLAEKLIRKASSEASVNWIVPGGFKLYESTDYSRDGRVSILNKATKGNGVNIYILGDGFADKDIEDGSYETIARQAMEAIFAEEPFKSCRDMLNVYMIEKVSKNNLYLEGATTAFSAYPSSTESGGLSFDQAKVKTEVKKIVGENEIEKTTAILFVNHYSNAGSAYLDSDWTRCDPATDYACGFAVAGACLSYFESTLRHEFGHAFAKLDEEYFTDGQSIPEEILNEKKTAQDNYGWWTNIDFTNDLSRIRWTDYVSDSRYSREGIGAYEGGGTFGVGVWRPTEYSIMRFNDGGYNAPSRETIYRRIHKLAYGASWEFDRETFKQWDVQRYSPFTKTSSDTRPVKRALKDYHIVSR